MRFEAGGQYDGRRVYISTIGVLAGRAPATRLPSAGVRISGPGVGHGLGVGSNRHGRGHHLGAQSSH
jgi:hypothetical protein